MARFETKICECCGQTIAVTRKQSRERHFETVLELYDVTEEELESKSRNVFLATARAHLWFLLVIEDYWSLDRAAKLFDRGHHATLHAVRKHGKENLGTTMKSSIKEIRYAYWHSLGLSEDEIQDKL